MKVILLIFVGLFLTLAIELAKIFWTTYQRKCFQKNISKWFPKPLLCVNSDGGVSAVCLYADFQRQLLDELASIEIGTPKSAQQIRVWVPTTFTFSLSEQDKRLMHTATELVFEQICADLAYKVTGRSINHWRKYQLEEKLYAYLMIRDKRLFVPFSGSNLALERQLSTFKKRGSAELRELLGVPY